MSSFCFDSIYDDFRLEEFNLRPEYFRHQSFVHGINHVYRVMFHVLNLGRFAENVYLTKLAFCSAFIHDMERTHDGVCYEHGYRAAQKALPDFENFFLSIGVKNEDIDVIAYATTMHSQPETILKPEKYAFVTKLLKDADGLDRVRLGDLDTSYLRFDFTLNFVDFAEEFFYKTDNLNFSNFSEIVEIGCDLLQSY